MHDGIEVLLRRRHSCRAFDGRQVSRDTMEAMFQVAQLTASWCNAQPWLVHVISGSALEQLRSALYSTARAGDALRPDLPFPEKYLGAYLERRRKCGWQLYESVGVLRGDREASGRQALENYRMFGAPHVAFVTSPREMGVYGALDCGGWVANFLLAAEMHGVACIPQAALAGYPDIVREQLGISDDRMVVCAVSFGYEDRSHPANGFRVGRASIEESVVWVDDAGGSA